jgi:Xaa-Pro aminopeptidase
MWYILEDGETQPPDEVQHLFDTVRHDVDTIIEHLQPGTLTWQPAEAARDVRVDASYAPMKFDVGHQIGHATHDGGVALGLRRADAPEQLIEPGNVYTAEGLETFLEGRGWISLEDDVLITTTDNEVLTTQQRDLRLLQ